MKKKSKSKQVMATPHIDPYLEGLMAKLLDRLTSLEKKVETVIAQTVLNPSAGGNQPKPSQVPEAQQTQRRERQLYEAICADCSSVCEVPFKPVEGRAVYCKICFGKRKNSSKSGMPVLTAVTLAPKPVSKLAVPQAVSVSVPPKKKIGKVAAVTKTKKSKK